MSDPIRGSQIKRNLCSPAYVCSAQEESDCKKCLHYEQAGELDEWCVHLYNEKATFGETCHSKAARNDADSTVMSQPIKALLRDIMRLYAAMAQADPDLIHDQEASEAFQVCGNHDSATFDALDSLIA